jgi:hypothetical protein
MMKQKKTIFLFLALILPICIFLFLKFFGRNEFAVQPLYVDVYPEIQEGCIAITMLPYDIPDSIRMQLPLTKDSLVIVFFGEMNYDAANQVKRIREQFINDPVELLSLRPSGKVLFWKNCIFFLKEPFNLVLVDRRGAIRGQYASADREDVDRLLTEVTIILKKY